MPGGRGCKVFKHGTVNMYKRHGCRCDLCKEARNQSQREYHARPHVKAKEATYRKDHAAKYAEHQRKFRATERGRLAKRTSESRRRAQRLGGFVEDVIASVVFDANHGVCGICEAPIVGPFHVDHILPLSRGGTHCYANVQATHPKCNNEKYNKVA